MTLEELVNQHHTQLNENDLYIWLCHIIWLIFNRKYCLIIVDK